MTLFLSSPGLCHYWVAFCMEHGSDKMCGIPVTGYKVVGNTFIDNVLYTITASTMTTLHITHQQQG